MKKLEKIQANDKTEQAFILEKYIATTSDRETTNPYYKHGFLNKRMRNKRSWLPQEHRDGLEDVYSPKT